MAKRQRKTEQDFLRARSALMRSIQRTNKAFGSNMRISDIVDVPTPAQAKKMSAAELRAASKRIKEARTDKGGEKFTFVPTGTGNVARVSTKDYNAAMAALGKRNKMLRERLNVLEEAKKPRRGGARPVSARDVQASRGQSKVMPVRELDAMTAFVGGAARGNVDEITKRFARRGKELTQAPRKWRESDARMRRNFEKLIKQSGNAGLIAKFQRLNEKQLLWATYEGNLSSFLEAAGYADYSFSKKSNGRGSGDLDTKERDGLAAAAANVVEDIIEEASRMVFK